ncbi:MAG: hypothetical protein R6U40_14685 [Desulfobacterales bacterium]
MNPNTGKMLHDGVYLFLRSRQKEIPYFPYKEAVKPMGDLGFFGTVIPESYGGEDMGGRVGQYLQVDHRPGSAGNPKGEQINSIDIIRSTTANTLRVRVQKSNSQTIKSMTASHHK